MDIPLQHTGFIIIIIIIFLNGLPKIPEISNTRTLHHLKHHVYYIAKNTIIHITSKHIKIKDTFSSTESLYK